MMYDIGNVILKIENVIDMQMLISLNEFEKESAKVDIVYRLHYVDVFPKSEEKIVYANSNLMVQKSLFGYRYIHFIEDRIFAITEENGNNFDIYLLKSIKEAKLHPYFLLSLLWIERIIVHKKEFLLHSAYVSYKEQGILFTAPSGGGKSTQAELWKVNKEADILNGDRSIVRKKDDKWMIYGTPYSGTSPYCVNITTPLNAIIILEKSMANQIERIGIKGFSKILAQTMINPWDKEMCNSIMELVKLVCEEIPIYKYSCRKDASAVEDLYRRLVEDGVLR